MEAKREISLEEAKRLAWPSVSAVVIAFDDDEHEKPTALATKATIAGRAADDLKYLYNTSTMDGDADTFLANVRGLVRAIHGLTAFQNALQALRGADMEVPSLERSPDEPGNPWHDAARWVKYTLHNMALPEGESYTPNPATVLHHYLVNG